MPVIFGPLDSTALKTGMMEITASAAETICNTQFIDSRPQTQVKAPYCKKEVIYEHNPKPLPSSFGQSLLEMA